MPILADLFETSDLIPHGFCLSWDPDLMGLHIVSDALIGLAYFSIPVCFTVFLARRRDLAFRWMFWLFAIFILACGSTHVLSIWTLWHPDYGLEGAVKGITAIASVLTAISLWPLIPKAVALPSPDALHTANLRLREQIRELDAAQRALREEGLERQRAEAMLFQAQKMEAIGKLTGGVAHDFNNVLAAIMTNLELLDRRLHDQNDLKRYTARALKAAARGGAVTQQLLTFARRQILKPVMFDVENLVADMADLLRGTLGSGITLEIAADPELWLAEADPNQLASALLNLVINARDATPQGGRVTIALENGTLAPSAPADETGRRNSLGDQGAEAGDYVIITISDTGSGMTAEVREAAFEPFFTTKPVGQGSGLGLSQVYGFARQSHGQVTLQSEPGRGTTVTLCLRRAQSPLPHQLTVPS